MSLLGTISVLNESNFEVQIAYQNMKELTDDGLASSLSVIFEKSQTVNSTFFINDLDQEMEDMVIRFADDAKLMIQLIS